ncbi:MAG: nitroreductase family protein [Fidelibacterota bacterium]
MRIGIIMIAVFMTINLFADEAIKLPAPDKTGGMPLMEALNNRQTNRNFSEKELNHQQLSNLLWAAWGINRENGKRTAPSAVNWQEIDIYVTLRDGAYRYDAQGHELELITDKNIMEYTGTQAFTRKAALNLVYVADYTKMSRDMDDNARKHYSWVDTGYISQNVYLYCASEGLATVVIGMVDREELRSHLPLQERQKIVLTQTVGYPAK